MATRFLKNGMQRIGNFEVDTNHLLGRGGFGEVFYGTLKSSGEKIAAKRVWIKRTTGNTLGEVLQEVGTLQKIEHHENIVKFFHSQRDKDCLWIFTEFCEHGSLNNYFVMHKLELRHKLDIIHQSLLAIDHLHNLRPLPVVHRDVKPANILITQREGNLVIKMADFGLAKITNSYFGTAWAMRTLCGTEAFMAPEQFALQATGKGEYDWSVDIFALGLITLSLMDTKSGYNLDAFEVSGRPLGLVLWRLHEDGQVVWSPVTFSLREPRAVREVKTLAAIMTSYDPRLRPTAADLAAEVNTIRQSVPPTSALPVKLQIEDDFTESLVTWSDPEEPTVIQAEEFPRKRRSPRRNTIKRRPTPGLQKNKFKGPDIRGTLHILSDKLSLPQSANPTQRTPKYVVLGGLVGSQAKPSSMCWVLETTADGFLWQGLTELPDDVVQYNSSLCKVNQDGFVVLGGGDGQHVSKKAFQYKAPGDSWKKLPDLPVGLCGAGVVQHDESIYVIGGEGKDHAILDVCLSFHFRTRSWTRQPAMPQPMLLPIMSATHDGIYVLFNTHPDNRAVQKTREISLQHFSPNERTWTYKAPLLSQIYDTLGASAVTVNQMVYVVGGWDKICAQYNTLTDMWTLLKNSLMVHVYNSAVHFHHKITMFGGAGANGPITDIEEYDIEKNTWRVRTLELPEPLHFHTCLVLQL